MEFDEIFEGDKNKMIALSVCRAADPEVLEPILRIIKEKGVRCHLVDDKEKLEAMLVSYEADHLIDNQIVIHHAEDDRAAATTALTLISTSQANVLMKGLISTAILLKEVLNKQHGMINDNLLSHVALFNIPNYHKAILLSDAGMNIAPSVEDKKENNRQYT
ncbi:hypothetical protein ACFOU0_14375 [Salinicoccus sesuvii]|uniref:Phosphate butyryltransferase n=1 Tax=Salinicoccus sesuvii TaxID=868281 RepID=A0ABV7N7Z3_9STAP